MLYIGSNILAQRYRSRIVVVPFESLCVQTSWRFYSHVQEATRILESDCIKFLNIDLQYVIKHLAVHSTVSQKVDCV
jgi:hypothetical protein